MQDIHGMHSMRVGDAETPKKLSTRVGDVDRGKGLPQSNITSTSAELGAGTCAETRRPEDVASCHRWRSTNKRITYTNEGAGDGTPCETNCKTTVTTRQPEKEAVQQHKTP